MMLTDIYIVKRSQILYIHNDSFCYFRFRVMFMYIALCIFTSSYVDCEG